MEKDAFVKISVIVPCYNVGNLVQPLLLSIEEQDYKNFEVIFINDGSSDNTSDVLREFCRKSIHRSQLKLIEQENKGVGNARNVGLDAAEGELVFFVDGDDYIFPQTLSRMAELMTDGIDIVAGAFRNHDNSISSFPHIENKEKWLRATIAKGGLTLWNKMFRKSIIDKNQIRFDTTVKKSEDHLFTAKYLMYSTGRVAVTDYAVYHYNQNPMSISNISMTTRTFSPWIADSVYVAVKIYKLLEGRLSSGTLRELRYDTYHKYRRIRHEAHLHKCKDKLFYNRMYTELRTIMPIHEILVFAVRRRISIITKSISRKIKKHRMPLSIGL